MLPFDLIDVSGFVADYNHPSGLRFPTIVYAAAKVFSSEPICRVEIKNPMDAGGAKLSVVTKSGECYSARFVFSDLATVAFDQDCWWEQAIQSARSTLNLQPR